MECFPRLILVILALINSIKSQLNDANTTVIPSTLSPNTTIAFMTIDPTTIPTEIPTTTTLIEGCSAIHGYIEATTNGQNARPQQINSYPVGFGPFSYRILNIPIIGFPPYTPNACNISNFNQKDVINKVVLLDGKIRPNCNYQQMTLNLQLLGAKGVLIGLNVPFFDYKGDKSLDIPVIPTRFIEWSDFFTLQNECCGFSNNDIRVTLDCFTNSYPSFICIEDEEYGRNDFYRINGEYEQQINYDENGHPVWKQDQIYNIDASTDWQIFFDINTFNWVIGEIGTTTNSIVAYCNDTITDNPINCGIWHEKPIWSPYYIKSNTLRIYEGLCPEGDPNKNTTNYCIQSNSNDMNGYTGTYKQLIQGIPEWFHQNDYGEVAIVYWTEIYLAPRVSNFGWKLVVGLNTKTFCIYSNDEDVSITNPVIRFYPTLCTEWKNASNALDGTFIINANICQNGTYHPTSNPLFTTTATSSSTSTSTSASISTLPFTSTLRSTSRTTDFIDSATSTSAPTVTFYNASTVYPNNETKGSISTQQAIDSQDKRDDGMTIIYILVALGICGLIIIIFCFIMYRWKIAKKRKSKGIELVNTDGRASSKLDIVAFDDEESKSEKVYINNNVNQTGLDGNDEKQTLISNNDTKI